jgi:Protein of unknown function (DUF2971)
MFQYTSVEGFLGILDSKRLWLSDLASANDPREIVLGRQKLLDALSSLLRHEYRGERGLRLSRLTQRLKGYFETHQAFCCCFSMAADELPMWAAYGAQYSGIALGFRPTAILAIPARVQRVKYIDPSSDEGFRQLATEVAERLELIEDSTSDPMPLPWIEAAVTAITAVTAAKHATWSYEREIRLNHIRRATPPSDPLTASIPTGELPKR